jgi:hypothetical protein
MGEACWHSTHTRVGLIFGGLYIWVYEIRVFLGFDRIEGLKVEH